MSDKLQKIDSVKITERLETDLSGMNFDSAYNYVVSYVTEYKEIQKKKFEHLNEKQIWENRVKLAMEKGKQELVTQANERIKDIEEKIRKFENRESELKITVEILKDELNKLSATKDNQFDAEKILAELQLMSGEIDNTEKEFKNMKINEQLDKMKKDLNKGGS